MQNTTAFRRKQLNQELQSLKKSLNIINKCIYHGEYYLEYDQIQLQLSLEELHQKMHNRTPEEEVEWVINEGTMSLRFLNLEKGWKEDTLTSVLKNNTELMSVEDILTAITDFYIDLYVCHDTKTSDQIDSFLASIPTFPVITQDMITLTLPITEKEILKAITMLRPGKTPGYDELTAEFYKTLDVSVAPILEQVFKEVWENMALSCTQKMAIIVLLYKKGDL